MGVKKLQTYMENHVGPEGFKVVSIAELKTQFEKDNPGSPIEILVDLECCLRFIYSSDTEFRFGGENVSLLQKLQNFFDKFNSLGIKVISFFGNFTHKNKRSEWVRRRYETVKRVYKIVNLVERKLFDNHPKEDLFVIPPGLCFTSTSIIKYVLKEKVIQSLTENDIEIITYGKKNKSFAILSQDSDFTIANAAQYYFSMKHLNLDTMTTRLYDGRVLAKVHNLHLDQLPLYATLLGTDLMNIDILRSYHNHFFRKKGGKMDMDYFFTQVANQCRHVECPNGVPHESQLVRIVRNIRDRGCHYSFDEVYSMVMESIQSFHVYQLEQELHLSKIRDEKARETLKIAMLLYRQCWITSDLLMLLCSRTTEMSTCLEIFEPNVKPIGIVLLKLRAVLYGATFNGDTSVQVEEFIVTGEGCFDQCVPHIRPARLAFVKPLLEVWNSTLEPDERNSNDYQECFDPEMTLESVVYKSIPSTEVRDMCKEYFVDLFCQSCRVSPQLKQDLLSKFKQGFPQAVLLPLFTFIYLEADSHAYLHPSERDAILFTFTTVSVLTRNEVQSFKHHRLKRSTAVPLMRAANMFRRAAHVMINLNAVCGFPIPVQWVDGHNFWQGTLVQLFHNFLYYQNHSQRELYQVIVEVIRTFDSSSVVDRFKNLIQSVAELNLLPRDFRT
ncbi:hypothetical protein M8J75_013347 [Diaphorina citri]|nr:hypothetical protein M8J75_013347 [Diaphorina citri]